MYQWKLIEHDLPLKYQWKIAHGEAQYKKIYQVSVNHNGITGLGEVAGVTQFEEDHGVPLPQLFAQISQWLQQGLLDRATDRIPRSLAFGISSAWTHLKAQQKQQSTTQYLGLAPTDKVRTSYALPILDASQTQEFYHTHQLHRFSALKIKINGPDGYLACKALSQLYPGPIWVDANQSFKNTQQALDFLKKMDSVNIALLEQPFQHSDWESHAQLKAQTDIKIFADESLQAQDIPTHWNTLFDGVNIKLMKSGSYHQAIQQIGQARQLGLKVMLGCMVETSLGIQSALNIASLADIFDLDGFMYLQNDPYQLVYEDHGWIYRQTGIPTV
jgi:L-Ala-D/L-Glu epimerase